MGALTAEHAMQSRRINGNCKLVYLLLAFDADDEGFTAVVTQEDIADRLGIGVTTVGAALMRLRDLGYVETVASIPNVGTVYRVTASKEAA
jgi:Mn-dependent DtxR family transcriptional regulator